jgi:hypothetical protein
MQEKWRIETPQEATEIRIRQINLRYLAAPVSQMARNKLHEA